MREASCVPGSVVFCAGLILSWVLRWPRQSWLLACGWRMMYWIGTPAERVVSDSPRSRPGLPVASRRLTGGQLCQSPEAKNEEGEVPTGKRMQETRPVRSKCRPCWTACGLCRRKTKHACAYTQTARIHTRCVHTHVYRSSSTRPH